MVETQVVGLPTYVKHDNLSEIYSGDKMHGDDYYVSDHLHPFDGRSYTYVPEERNWVIANQLEWDKVRVVRDQLITDFYWKVDRQRDRIALGSATSDTLTPLLQYIQTLRDIPQVQTDPLNVIWPTPPQCD